VTRNKATSPARSSGRSPEAVRVSSLSCGVRATNGNRGEGPFGRSHFDIRLGTDADVGSVRANQSCRIDCGDYRGKPAKLQPADVRTLAVPCIMGRYQALIRSVEWRGVRYNFIHQANGSNARTSCCSRRCVYQSHEGRGEPSHIDFEADSSPHRPGLPLMVHVPRNLQTVVDAPQNSLQHLPPDRACVFQTLSVSGGALKTRGS